MTANSKQFGTRGDFTSKQVNEVSISNIDNKVNDLTSLMRSLACENGQHVKVCSVAPDIARGPKNNLDCGKKNRFLKFWFF
jgi:carbonic anhydrase